MKIHGLVPVLGTLVAIAAGFIGVLLQPFLHEWVVPVIVLFIAVADWLVIRKFPPK